MRHQRGARAVAVREPVVDRGVGGLLQLAVDRRAHAQAALERQPRALLPAAEAVDDLLLDPRGEVGVGGVLGRRLEVAAVGQRLLDRVLVLLQGQEVLVAHVAEHQVAPRERGLRVRDRVVGAGRRDHAGQQRRLVRRQPGGAVVAAPLVAPGVVRLEVRARGRLDAVRAVAEVDRVQVVAEDLLLRPLAREVVGEGGLAELLEHRPLVLGGERVLDELLGDRRAALDDLLLDDVLVEGARDAAQVDAVVGVEAAVLDRDDRVLHDRRDLVLAQEQPLLVAGQDADPVPVAVVDDRVARGRLLELGQVGGDGHQHPEHGRDGGQDAEAEQEREQAQLADADAAAGRRGLALAVRP